MGVMSSTLDTNIHNMNQVGVINTENTSINTSACNFSFHGDVSLASRSSVVSMPIIPLDNSIYDHLDMTNVKEVLMLKTGLAPTLKLEAMSRSDLHAMRNAETLSTPACLGNHIYLVIIFKPENPESPNLCKYIQTGYGQENLIALVEWIPGECLYNPESNDYAHLSSSAELSHYNFTRDYIANRWIFVEPEPSYKPTWDCRYNLKMNGKGTHAAMGQYLRCRWKSNESIYVYVDVNHSNGFVKSIAELRLFCLNELSQHPKYPCLVIGYNCQSFSSNVMRFLRNVYKL